MNGESPEQHALVLAAGVVSVLLLASVVGVVLKLRVGRGQPHAVIDNLNVRVGAWWAMAAMVGLALTAGHAGATLLFAFASAIALREFAGGGGARAAVRTLSWATFFVVLPCQYLLVWLGRYDLYATLIPIYAFMIVPVVAAAAGERGLVQRRCSSLRWGVVICVYCISHIPAVFTLEITGYEGRNAFLVLFLILVTQASDVLQYVWGKLAGRRRIAPRLSPAKTVEGTAGGVLTATALGAALSWMTPFTVTQAALIALTIALLGFAGGLLLSGIKRRRGIKDWGTMIKGHGGMLDRLDSLWLSAPVFFYIVSQGWARG